MFEDFFDNLEKEFESRVVGATLDAGFDALGIKKDSKPAVDLKPVLDALTEIMAQGSRLLEVLQRPTETAGNELCQRAATALFHGWYSDSLRDAVASVEQYPYRATPYLIGALAALKLGDTSHSMKLLVQCVKYSANGEREVGAVAALLGAGLANTAQLPQFSVHLLQLSDQITEHSCPPVVAALASFMPDPERDSQLLGLWWAEEGREAKAEIAASWSGRITAIPSASAAPYADAGGRFRADASAIALTIAQLSNARSNLRAQVERLGRAVGQSLPEHDALDSVLKQRYGVKAPVYTSHTLKKTLQSLIAFDNPAIRTERMFVYQGAADVEDLRRSFRMIRMAAKLLMDLVNLGMESPTTPTQLISDWSVLGDPSKQLLYQLCRPGAASMWPGWHAESGKVLRFHFRYTELLNEVAKSTTEDNVDAVVAATLNYEAVTGSLPRLSPMSLPVRPWLPRLGA